CFTPMGAPHRCGTKPRRGPGPAVASCTSMCSPSQEALAIMLCYAAAELSSGSLTKCRQNSCYAVASRGTSMQLFAWRLLAFSEPGPGASCLVSNPLGGTAVAWHISALSRFQTNMWTTEQRGLLMALVFEFNRLALTNVDDAAGRWQFEAGQ